jgi:predicted DNA-binding protein
MITKYSGESVMITARIPVELFDRLTQKSEELEISRSLFVRTMIECAVLKPEEMKALFARERAVIDYIRSGNTQPHLEFDP